MQDPDMRHQIRIETLSPDGEPIPLPFLYRARHASVALRGGDAVVPEDGARLDFESPGGSFELDSLYHRSQEKRARILLQLCLVEIWLSDAGGLDLGGVPLTLRSAVGTFHGRIGTPLLVWAGRYSLEVGGKWSLFPSRVFEISLAKGRESMDFGRMGALTASWGEGRGWPLWATRLEDGWCHQGRLGHPLTLWPGRYRVHVEGGPQAEVDVPAGVLTEIDLAAPRTSTLRTALGDYARDGFTSFIALTKRRCARWPALQQALANLEQHRKPRGGELRAALEAKGALKLNAVDARGYRLTGWPYRLWPQESTKTSSTLEGRIGIPLPVSPGQYNVELFGIPGIAGRVVVEEGNDLSTLVTPGALRVVYRDGLGRSLRGQAYRIAGEYGQTYGVLSLERLLLPGRYTLTLDVFPSLQRSFEIHSGEVLQIDLGAMGRYVAQPSEDTPWGTTILAQPLNDEGEGIGAPVQVGKVGEPLDLPAQSYLLTIGSSKPKRVDLRIGRMRKPSVVGRGFDPLDHDDANRESASGQGV